MVTPPKYVLQYWDGFITKDFNMCRIWYVKMSGGRRRAAYVTGQAADHQEVKRELSHWFTAQLNTTDTNTLYPSERSSAQPNGRSNHAECVTILELAKTFELEQTLL